MTSIASSFAISSLVEVLCRGRQTANNSIRPANLPSRAGPKPIVIREIRVFTVSGIALVRVQWKKDFKNTFPLNSRITPARFQENTDYTETACGVPEETRVSTSGPSSVIAMVCSEWALGWPSSVTTVQPSDKTFV